MSTEDVRGRVELRLLGGLELRRDGVPVTGFRSRKPLLLLAYLAVRRTPQSRAWLVELLWPRTSAAQGRAELARVLNDVKTRVGPVLAADRERVGVVPGAVVDDLALLESAETSADPAAAATAVAGYRGPFLAGTEVVEPELAQWVEEQRHRTDVVVGALLERLCRSATADDAALVWARRWVAHAPAAEEAHRAVIRLLARTGRPAAALAHYAGLEERLARELGVAPDPGTVALVRAVRAKRGEAVVPVPELPALPLSWSPLLGRDALVGLVGERLVTSHTRLVTLTGAGGIGKTRVAVEAARRSADVFDAVGFVDLIAVRQAGLVDDAIRRQLGLVTGPDLRLALRRQLGGARILLVLDNLEQIRDVADHVLGLLTELPRLVVLATSRGRLRLVGEQVVEVSALGLDDAVALLRQQAEDGGAGDRLREAEGRGQDVRALCRRLGGLPLAVELAAVGLRTLDLEQLGDRLTAADAVVAGERNRPARHRTVRDAVRWSVDLLEPEDRRTFAWTAAFVTPVRAVRLAELTGTAGSRSDAALRAMSEVGLVRRERRAAGPADPAARTGAHGFAALPLVRAVAGADLRASGSQPTAHRRHADLYLRLAHASSRRGQDPDGRDQIDRLLELESEIDEVRVALERAAARSVVELARWCFELRVFWQMCGHIGEALGWAERVLAAPDGLDPLSHAWVLVLAEWATIRTGDLDRSHELHEQLVPLVRAWPDHEIAVYAASTGGGYALHRGRMEEAVTLAEEVRVLADERGVVEVQLNQRSSLAFVAQVLGQGERAVALAREGVEISVRQGDVQWRTVLQSVLGGGLLIAGDPGGAGAVYADALERIARTGDTFMARPCLIGAAEVASALGRDRESAQLVGAVIALDGAIGEIPGLYTAARDRLSAQLPVRLGRPAYEQEVTTGRRLSLGQGAALVGGLPVAGTFPENSRRVAP